VRANQFTDVHASGEFRKPVATLPVQRHPGLPFAAGLRGFPGLLDGLQSPVSWTKFASRLKYNQEQVTVDEIELSVDEPGFAAPLRLMRVVIGVPQWVVWTVLERHPRRREMLSGGWHFWLPEDAADWAHPQRLQRADSAEPYLVATWRSDTLYARRAALSCLPNLAERLTPASLSARVSRCDPNEASRRNRQLADMERARAWLGQGGFVGWKHAIGGACAKCGRPLRDPASLQRGIGPECWRTGGVLLESLPFSVEELARTDVPAWMWVGALPVASWKERLSRSVRQFSVGAKLVPERI
jgi:hypothetical protein